MSRAHPMMAVLAAALAGCSAVHLDLPDTFVPLDESLREFKAMTADGSILWIHRTGLPEGGGSLAFWVEALRDDFESNRGYTLVEQRPAATGAGTTGTELVYTAQVDGLAYSYSIALFVTGSASDPVLYTARFTAETDAFDKHIDAVRAAVGRAEL